MKIILSIDGGGIRGIIPTVILDYLEKRVQEIKQDKNIKIGSLVDFVAGTSTGSIIGSLILLPSEDLQNLPKYAMSDIIKMYTSLGPTVFKKTLLHNIKTAWGLLGPVYPSSNIEKPLIEMLTDKKLKDLIKPCLFTGYDINKRRVDIFTNNDKNKKYQNYLVKDVVRGSTSIPAYFKPAYFKEGVNISTLIDGGVFANNPSMVAYTEASKTLFTIETSIKECNPNNILMISLGSGKSNKDTYPYNKSKKWGLVRWFLPILDIILSASSDIAEHETQKLFESFGANDNYIRINPDLKHSTTPSTDGSEENITKLLKDVSVYLAENKEYLDNVAARICDIKAL